MGDAIREQEMMGGSGDMIVRFLVVCGILIGVSGVSGLFWGRRKDGKEKGKER